MRTLSKRPKGSFVPKTYDLGHDLSFVLHDLLTHFLVSGEQSKIFATKIENVKGAGIPDFGTGWELFSWLSESERFADRARVLKTTVLPAVLSDMLHCLYEALEASRKAKLNVTYILIRKPIQESLFLLESIALDEIDFGNKLATDPLQLRTKSVGSLEQHAKRIQSVLDLIGKADRFDATYLAQLRYSKVNDGFDGICNKAIHLFTEHKAIRTDALDINFIFSDWESKETQWSYLYTRLPYLLAYAHHLVRYLGEGIIKTLPDFLDYEDRRIAALTALWSDAIPSGYENEHLDLFVLNTYDWLVAHCEQYSKRPPTRQDLVRMARNGAFPGESSFAVFARDRKFARLASGIENYQ